MPDDAQLASYARLLRLSPIAEAPLPAPLSTSAIAATGRLPRRNVAGLWSFLLLVILPVCVISTYYWALAADRYEAQTSFVLRAPGGSIALNALSNFLPTGNILRAAEDGVIVRDYLESRDAMQWLEKHANLRTAYGKAKRDLVWGFPTPFYSDGEEGLFKHYRRMTSATFDNDTGVGFLTVEAFTPEDAQRLATSLLDAAEGLVNRLNERSREDAVSLAFAEVEHMRARTAAAQAALTAFRERERLIDPSQATLAVLQTIGRLSQEVAQTSVQISELRQSSVKSPQIAQLRIRQGALEAQIAQERKRLAGDAHAIAPRIAEYERLLLEREFADKALLAAMTALETSRVETQRQHIYLERVAAPGRPDYPAYPWRTIWCLATFIAGCMIWRMWRIIANDALRHNSL